ncbi:acyltransferase [Rahnella aquatilis]|nr:acyltransferase [Rahnella aquatilis]
MIKNVNLDIQALRAVAVFMVIGQHYRNRLPTPLWYQEILNHVSFLGGVDIFFAISGYLMCATLFRDVSNNGKNITTFLSFFKRRFFRLMPAAIFWVLFTIFIATFFTVIKTNISDVVSSGIAALFGYANIFWYGCFSGVYECGSYDLNVVNWSLSLEWQMYLVLAAAVFLLNARYLVAFLLLAFISHSFISAHDNVLTGVAWWFRPQAFSLGALTFVLGIKCKLPIPLRLLSLTMALLLLIASLNFSNEYKYISIGVFGWLCFFTTISERKIITSKNNILVLIGERSYSIYLCHMPAIYTVKEVAYSIGTHLNFTIGTATTLMLMIFITFIYSEVSYRFIELNFIKKSYLADGNQHC